MSPPIWSGCSISILLGFHFSQEFNEANPADFYLSDDACFPSSFAQRTFSFSFLHHSILPRAALLHVCPQRNEVFPTKRARSRQDRVLHSSILSGLPRLDSATMSKSLGVSSTPHPCPRPTSGTGDGSIFSKSGFVAFAGTGRVTRCSVVALARAGH